MEIAHEIKALKNLIKINTEDDFAFGFELAVVASRRNFVNLKMWFEENNNNRVFIDELVKYNTQAKRISLSNDVQKLIDDTLRPLQAPPAQQQAAGMMPTMGQDDLLQSRFQGMSLSPNPGVPQLGDLSNYKQPQATQQQPGTFDYSGGYQQSTTSPIVSGGTVPGLSSFDVISTTAASTQQSLPFLNQLNQGAAGGGVPRSLAGQLGHQQHPQGFNMFGDQSRPAAFPTDGSSKAHIDQLFKELYEHKTVTPDEFVEQLKRMKHQNKDLDDFMEPLWKEFKYLNTYPTEVLKTTAFVWGKILGEELLDDSQYCSKFLNKVIEALEIGMRSNSGNEKMVIFGETVLQQFILPNKHKRILSKKKIYMQFCERIVTSGWFRQGGEKRLQPPMLVSLIKDCVKEQRSIIPTPDPSAIRTRPDITEPPEEIQDRIGFIYNNLSNNNLKQKSAEMRKALESNPDYFLWLANYIVVKRVLKEENFLQTYADVVEELNNKLAESGTLKAPFNEMVKDELISAIKQLLQKDKQSTDMESRKMLKHFGAFLGLITIARDKPVLADDIDFRFLLLEAYQKGHVELQFVVPFVVKVLEATKKSRLFQLKLPADDQNDDHMHRKKRASGNAWTLGVMNTLMELYKTHDATLNLKFEVEILCKEHLKLELDQFEAAEPFLTNDEAKRNIISQLSMPKQQQQQQQQQSPVEEPQMRPQAPQQPGYQPMGQPQQPPPQPNQPQYHYDQIDHEADLYSLEKHIKVREPSGIPLPADAIKRHIVVAIQAALSEKNSPSSELVQRIIERSCKIATTTTENLVKKDFALDSDDTLMLTTAHNQARYLGAAMAMNGLSTNKELHQSIANHLTDELYQQFQDPSKRETLIRTASVLASDNLDLVVNYVQKRAAERAVQAVTNRLRDEIQIRRHARETGNDRAFLTGRQELIRYHMQNMPEQIRLTPGSVKAESLAVYDDYARNIPGFLPNLDYKPLPRQRPAQANWLSDVGVQIYSKFLQEFIEDVKDAPMQIENTRDIVTPVIDAARHAMISRDEDSTTDFIQRLVIRFFFAYNRSQNEELPDARYAWEFMTRILARRLALLQPEMDDKLIGQKDWFAGKVLISLHWKNSTALLLNPQLLEARFAEAIKLLIFNKLIMPQDYDKALMTSMRHIK